MSEKEKIKWNEPWLIEEYVKIGIVSLIILSLLWFNF